MVMSRKGIIFSLIAIGLSGLFILLFASGFVQHVDGQNEIVRTRIINLDETINEFYVYAGVAQQAAGQHALAALYDEINSTGNYLTNFTDSLAKCMNNSVGCTNDQPLQEFLDNYTQAIKKTRNADLNYMIMRMWITRESYWSLNIASNISIIMNDSYATWHYSQVVESRISTIGTYDPLFLELQKLYGGTKERRIASSPFNKKMQTINFSTFMDFYTIGQYQYSDNGSCLSQRFEGKFLNPTGNCGIESVLNPDEFMNLWPVHQDIVHLDWQAVRGITYPCSERHNITRMNSELHLWYNDSTTYGLFPLHAVKCQ